MNKILIDIFYYALFLFISFEWKTGKCGFNSFPTKMSELKLLSQITTGSPFHKHHICDHFWKSEFIWYSIQWYKGNSNNISIISQITHPFNNHSKSFMAYPIFILLTSHETHFFSCIQTLWLTLYAQGLQWFFFSVFLNMQNYGTLSTYLENLYFHMKPELTVNHDANKLARLPCRAQQELR